MSEKDKIVIIIASYNGNKYWPSLMSLLIKEKYSQFDLEVLVVDNNSSDGSADFLEKNYPQVKVIRNSINTGFVGANNIGYQYAKKIGAKYIYLLNQDTEVSPDFLLPLYEFAQKNSHFGSLQSKLRLWPDKDKLNTIGNAIHFLGFGYGVGLGVVDKNDQKIKKINCASGAGEFLSMEALEEKGGLFDENMFMYLEDLDLGWQLSLLGRDNYFIPESIIYHKYEF
ncbi:MAG: glycosyltransferase family 2 protein, partial [bacterium]|nr:glycosyltransferase family 2 protein [bacterium]